jgi:hypothetical protein
MGKGENIQCSTSNELRLFPAAIRWKAAILTTKSCCDRSWTFPGISQFDAVARYVDTLPASPLTGISLNPSYITFDVRLAWHFKSWEVSLVGQNFSDNQHSEFAAQIPRSVYGKVTFRW